MADIIEKFKETEAKYNELREKHKRGELDAQAVKAELKGLMLQDEDGRYWMLGGKSGRWYVHDGAQWQEADPYEQFEPYQLEQEEMAPDTAASAQEQESAVSVPTSEEYPVSTESHYEYESGYESESESESESAAQSFIPLESEKEKQSDDFYKDMQVESHSYDVSSADRDAGVQAHEDPETANIQQAQPVDTKEYYVLEDRQEVESETTEPTFEEEQASVEIELEQEEAAAEEAFPAEDTSMGMGAEAGMEVGAEAAPAAAVAHRDEKETAPQQDVQWIKCRICQSRIPPYAVYCSFCGAHQKELDKKSRVKPLKKGMESELLVKYIGVTSFLFFLGGIGLIAGVILGACFGIFGSFMPGLADQLPMMLSESRGGVAGGVIFAAIGGIGGFFLSAVLSLVLSGIYNLISLVFGGIRFKIKQ